ncbi:alpha/beta hydrolase [Herbivorax sp. ANBcel31]|uniref:alpha/beta fold hydrolase n=1 Tax=Herbivorax sp. ANBcel31 TaxID=3069754 RepID=UPI0027B6DAA8|nr:alpha/beta hydrolase [Herbivorax sp. ANBcel31]MDQ2085322.1 alpha/beta hydrolase [Herbivorax sp. ANBcel31]
MKRRMVVLTGWSVGKFPWKTLLSLLNKHFEIIFVDWENVFSVDGFKKKVFSLLSEKKLEKFSLMGWSLGSITAMDIAAHFPEKIENLILISGTLRFVKDEKKLYSTLWTKETIDKMIYMLKIDKDKILNKFYKNLFSKSEKSAGHYKRFISEVQCTKADYSVNSLLNGLEYLKVMDLRNISPDISPLLIHGCEDVICPYESGEYINKKFKNSNLVKLQGCGHIPFYTDPDTCYEIIEKHIEVESL